MATTKVASIYFAPLYTRRGYRGAPYKLPAVPRGQDPAILECHDLIQRDWGPMIQGTNKRQEYRWLVTGDEIARDIVGEWTGDTVGSHGMDPQCHPGIWIVRDRIAVTEQHGKLVNSEMTFEERQVLDAENKQVFRPATPTEMRDMWEEDLEAARAADRNYANWCWNRGNALYASQQRGEVGVLKEVPLVFKLGARQYGLDAEWLKEASSVEMQACPHCEKTIGKTAMMCKFCSQPVDLRRWAQWQSKKDAALLDAQTAPTPPPPPAPQGNGIATRKAA